MTSQVEQMRQAIDRLLGEIICLEGAVLYKDPWPELELRVRDMKKIAEQALLTHTLNAEKIVRLTGEEMAACVVMSDSFCRKENRWCINSKKYANALQDALIKKNGG